MPNVFLTDSFSHYATADMNKKWSTAAGDFAIAPAGGRTAGTGSVGWVYTGAGGYAAVEVPNPAVLSIEAAVRITTDVWAGHPDSQNTIFQITDINGMPHLSLALTTAREFRLCRGLAYEPIFTTTGLGFGPGLTWRHVGLRASIGPSGTFEIRVNNTPVGSGSGNTSNDGTSPAGMARITAIKQVTTEFCDLVIADDFCGDCTVLLLPPDTPGLYQDWQASAGTALECIDDPQFNGDTDFLHTMSAGRASFGHAAIGKPGGVVAVQQTSALRKDDPAPSTVRTVRQFLRINGADFEGADTALSQQYVMLRKVWSVNPATGSSWTQAQVDALESGVRLV